MAVMLSYMYIGRECCRTADFTLVWLVSSYAPGAVIPVLTVWVVLIGKHKMAPKLSPKKSIEGAVGGVVGAALLGRYLRLCIQECHGMVPQQASLVYGS